METTVQLDVVDAERRIVSDPYLIRLPGWTWERYLSEAPEMRFCEYERGDLIVHSPVGVDHQRVVRFLTYLLQTWCVARQAGEVLNGPAVVRVGVQIGREPDVFVLAPDAMPRGGGKVVNGVPLLIVEVASASTRKLDLETKAGEYAAFGVPEYWVVERDARALHRHRLDGGAFRVDVLGSGRLAAEELRGFWIELEWLWAVPLPSELDCARAVLAAR